jgi:hypothetical protein
MPKGLLAEWRKGIVSRGLAAALLLAVPVSVAAMIGFEGSIGGLGEGLDSLASGPGTSQASPAADTDPIDAAISALAVPTAPAPGGGQDGSGGGGGDGGDGAPTPGSPGGDAPGGGTGGGGPTDVIDPPDVSPPSTNPVGDIVDDVQKGVGGLLP